MRKTTMIGWLGVGLVALIAISAAPGVSWVAAQDGSEAAHLVLTVGAGGDAQINRMDWDVNAFSPLYPGASVRASDYVELSGRTTVLILCTDLTPLDQRGSEVPRCNPYPSQTAFYYADDPAWSMAGGVSSVTTLPADLATLPAEVRDPNRYSRAELSGADLDTVLAAAGTIAVLDAPADAKAFALSSYYRGKNLLFEALGALTALPDLGCTASRPTVSAPDADDRPLVQTPVLYLRLGELYEMLGQDDDALRNYLCASQLAETLSDPADLALAYARQANLVSDPVQAIDLYQRAITSYAALGALTNANTMLETCGSRNCAMP